jgi:hypothetical protein
MKDTTIFTRDLFWANWIFGGFWVHGIRSCTTASNGICTSILLFFAVYVIFAWTAQVADRSVHSSVQIFTVDFGFLMNERTGD